MPTSYELEKARLVNFITAIQDLIDEHKVSDDLKEPLKNALDDAIDTLQDLEQDHG